MLGSKRKSLKRRNFTFGEHNGFDSLFTHSHYIRILTVKIPRYSNGAVLNFDVYDFLQGKDKSNSFYNPSYPRAFVMT